MRQPINSSPHEALFFLEGGGEMGELIRRFDWSTTPVGAPGTWPPVLRTTLSMILSSRFPMFLWWGEDLIQFYNDAYRPSLGNNGKHPTALGQKAKDCWPEIWSIIYPLIEQVKTTGQATWSEDQLIPIFRNGKIEDVYWTFGYSAIRNEQGTIEGVLVVCNETTAKVQALNRIENMVTGRTKELAAANTTLQRSNEELAQFAYIASHDLQEPLRKISNFSQMLERSLGSLDDRSAHYLAKINTSVARMITLVRDVLSFSQISHSASAFEPVDLNAIVEGILNDFELLIEEKNAVVSYAHLPTIEAIPIEMRQLFGNLISNSLKFSSPGRDPLIVIDSAEATAEELMAHALDMNAPYYKVTVRDNGIGFDQAQSEKIFQIFQRLHGMAEFAGTGIGLALCKKIAQKHHGDINALSADNTGATFYLLLPSVQPK